jgi:dihydroorotate dehydrogenase (fumarate)
LPETNTFYGPLKIKNPLVVASAGTSEHLELIKAAEDQGAAAVVIKTLFEEEYTRSNPAPCYSIINRRSGPMNSTTFYSFEQASPWGLERYAEEVYRAAREVSIPVIASINCVTNRAWADYAASLEQAGAAALELNRSCPYSKTLLEGKDAWTALAAETVNLVRKNVSIPVCIKLTPQLSDPLLTAISLEQAGAEGLVMFSRFTGLEIDLDREAPIMHGGFAGHGGTWAFHYALRWIAAASPQVRLPISASGGACSGDDVVKYILAGAWSVQLCTALYMEGFKVIGRCLERLKSFMEEKGYARLDQFRGKVCARIIPPDRVERGNTAVASVDPVLCTGCGICARACLHHAVHREESSVSISKKDCAGCGLCVQLCPASAISMGEA